MDDLDAALAEVTRGLADLTRQVGPEAAEATLTAVQLGAVYSLVFNFAGFIVFGILLYTSVRVFKHGLKLENSNKDGVFYIAGACIAGAVSLIFVVICLLSCFWPQTWLSVTNPAAGLAYRLLEKL